MQKTTGSIRPPATIGGRRAESLRAVSWRLEPRDLVIASLLYEHRTLTTSQIAAILFTSDRTCRNRLAALRKLGFVDWFVPIRRGRRLTTHWLPGLLAARYVALRDGGRPPTAKAVREMQDRVVATSHLAHIDATNQFFVDLITLSRQRPDARLVRWWSGPRTATAFGRRVHPDGHGLWRDGGRQAAFFLETDLGNETQSVLAAKVASYERLRLVGGPAWPVLFWLLTPAREANLVARLESTAPPLVPVATANRRSATEVGPAGSVWTVVGAGADRVSLADLPSAANAAGTFDPGPPTADQDPLYLLGHDPADR